MQLKKFSKIFIAWFLIIYGIAGIVAAISGVFLVWKYGWDLNSFASGFQGSVESEFRSMSGTMNDASTAATNAATSIRNAKNSLYTASSFTQRSGSAFKTIASYVGFQILNWRPFDSSYQFFIEGGDNLNSLSTQLSQTANSLETNAQDIDRLSRDFRDMGTKLNEVSTKFTVATNLGSMEWRVKNFITYALWYFASLHFIILITGIVILIL